LINSKDRILQQLNLENPSPIVFTADNLLFSNPVPDLGPTWNTKVTLSGATGSGLLGSVEVRYRRIPLPELGTYIGLETEVPFTAQTLLDALNVARESFVTLDDLEPIVLPTPQNGVVQTISLSAKVSSLGWTGGKNIEIVSGIPKSAEALHTLLHVTMPAKDYL
jgi:hypothetical protein